MAARRHDFTATELKAGVTVVAGLLVFALFVAVVNGLRVPQAEKTFYTEFSDTAGLNRNADVRWGGLKAGRVTEIVPSPDDQSKIRVTWAVGVETPVNADSRATVSWVSIASEMHLEVSTGSKDAPELAGGEFVPPKEGGAGMFGILDSIAASVSNVLTDEGILGDLRKLLGVKEAESDPDKAVVSINDLLAGADKLTDEGTRLMTDMRGTIEGNRERVKQVFTKLHEAEESATELLETLKEVVDENRKDLRASVSNARDVMQKLSDLADRFDQGADQIENLLRGAEGLTGEARGLLARGRPALEAMLQDLRGAVIDLRRFARILAEEPQALLRGKSPVGR